MDFSSLGEVKPQAPKSRFDFSSLGEVPQNDPIGLTPELDQHVQNMDPNGDFLNGPDPSKEYIGSAIHDMGMFANNVWGVAKEGVGRIGTGLKNIVGEESSDTYVPEEGNQPARTVPSVGGRDIMNRFQQSSTGLGQVGAGVLETLASPFAGAFQPVVNTATRGFKESFDLLPEEVRKPIADEAKTIWDAIPSDVKARGGDLMWLLGGLKGGEPIAKAETAVAKGGANLIKDVGEAAKEKIVTNLNESTKADWARPAEQPKVFIEAGKVYKKAMKEGNDLSQTALENGLALKDYTQRVGNRDVFDTKEIVQAIRDDSHKASDDLLRQSLIKADESGFYPKTPAETIMQRAIEIAKNDTSKDKPTIIQNIKDEFSDTREGSLVSDHPEGFSLKDMHEAKKSYSKGQYDPTEPTKGTSDKYISQAFKEVTEKKAPKDVPVSEFNAELEKNLALADYLEKLNGKNVPKTFFTEAASQIGKLAGGAIGESLTGGITGGYAGYKLTGIVENMLGKLPEYSKSQALKNLEKENPEAFAQVQQYLKKVDMPTNPLLPEGKPQAIPLPEESATALKNRYPGGVLDESLTQQKGKKFSPLQNQTPAPKKTPAQILYEAMPH